MSQFYQQQTPYPNPYPTPSLTSLRPPPRAILRPSDPNSSTSDLTIRPSTATLRAPVTHRKHSASTLQAGPTPSTSRKPSTSTLHSGPSSSSTTTNPPPSNKLTKRASTPSIRTLMHTRSTTSLRHPRQRKPSPAPSISAPAPPTKLLRLSELLDPDDLLREEQAAAGPSGDISEGRVIMGEGRRMMVQSPSGQQLDAEAYARRPDRPLTVQERQVRIREETLRKQDEARRAQLRRVTAKKERGCCGVM